MSMAQAYMSTHPLIVLLYVGLYARMLLHHGYRDNAENVKAAVELRLQAYNAKIALPSTVSLAAMTCCTERHRLRARELLPACAL